MENRENVGKEAKKEVLIIIPAYNEEKTIVPLLEKLEQSEIAQVADVLVVNDASQDKTNHVTKKRNHTAVSYTHLFRVDTYAILCVFYLVQVFFIHMVLLAVMKLLCRSLYLPYAGVFVYILGNLWAKQTYSRFGASLPQELDVYKRQHMDSGMG